MTRIKRFSSAALGMVLLAGLAFYQGHGELASSEGNVLSGTAIAETVELPGEECEGKAYPEGQGTEACEEKESSSGTN
jgi:hypothetical protein